MIIGITGGTGCGKTTALKAIAELGGVVIDCDKVYHDLLKTDTSLLSAIEKRFPQTVSANRLNRKALADIVFADSAALADLNQITHQAVKKAVIAMLNPRPNLAAIDAIALFESGLSELCDATVAITAPESLRIPRLTARDGISQAAAQARINAQPAQEQFIEKCDYYLENDGNTHAFHSKCLAFFKNLAIIKEKE